MVRCCYAAYCIATQRTRVGTRTRTYYENDVIAMGRSVIVPYVQSMAFSSFMEASSGLIMLMTRKLIMSFSCMEGIRVRGGGGGGGSTVDTVASL